MISREGDLIQFECDGPRCNEFFETETWNFKLALARLTQAGWRAIRPGTEYLHLCPSCHEDYQAERKKKLAETARKLKGI
jgi:hypothetical protein